MPETAISQVLKQARFYGILDSSYVGPRQWVAKCQAMLDGGADLVQLRAKRETVAERTILLEQILPLFANNRVPLIINDDLGLALSHPGLGLHIGQDDLAPVAARQQLGPDRILGLSTHTLDQAKSALALKDTLNYFAVGPIFPTPTKPNATPVGLTLATQVQALKPALPFFAIGGLKRQNIAWARQAGIARAVVVSDVLCAQDTAAAVSQVRKSLS